MQCDESDPCKKNIFFFYFNRLLQVTPDLPEVQQLLNCNVKRYVFLVVFVVQNLKQV